jgi:hypothetical protein
MTRLRILLTLAAVFTCASGCMRPSTITPTHLPTATTALAASATPLPIDPSPTAPVPSPTSESIPLVTPQDSGWEPLRKGLERRAIQVRDAEGLTLESLFILRVDPSLYAFRTAYQPQGKMLEGWLADSGALIAINGGYYRMEGETMIPTGLTIIDGGLMGESYGDFAGMLAVNEAGPDLRWLAQVPYDPAEALTSAVQSFPLLIKSGGELGFPAELEDYQQARRTVIARDRAGRFLLLVAPRGYFTLHQLSRFLTESDLELDIALNLDGGPSSGLLLAEPPGGEPALLPVPVVILVFAK